MSEEKLEKEQLQLEEVKPRKVGFKHSFISKAEGSHVRLFGALNTNGVKQIILLIILGAYSVLGGMMFCMLENPHLQDEYERTKDFANESRKVKLHNYEMMEERIEELIYELRINVIEEEVERLNLSQLISNITWAERPLSQRLKTVEDHKANLREAMIWYDHVNECRTVVEESVRKPWDIWEGIFYAWTLYSTIGYGNIYASSPEGQIATIFFSLLGIPFLITLLNEWGNYLFTIMLFLWNRVLTSIAYARNRIRRLSTFAARRRRRQNTFNTFGGIAAATGELTGTKDLWKQARGRFKRHNGEMKEEEAGPAALDLPLLLVLVIFVVWICISAAIYCLFEGWTYFTSVYFVFISLTTIGLGDVSPTKPKYTVLSLVLILVCLSVISMALSVVQWKIEALFGRVIKKIDEEYKRKISVASIQKLEVSHQMADSIVSSSPSDLQASTSSEIPLMEQSKSSEKDIPEEGVMESIVAEEGIRASLLFRLMGSHKKKLLHQHEEQKASLRNRGVQAMLTEPREIAIQAGPNDSSKAIAEVYATGEFVSARSSMKTPFTRDIYVYNI